MLSQQRLKKRLMSWLIDALDRASIQMRLKRKRLLWEMMDRRCAYCGNEISLKEATIDHRVPVLYGGVSISKNSLCACGSCNRVKGPLKTLEFRARTIGLDRKFFYESGVPIDVKRAKLWSELYKKLLEKKKKEEKEEKEESSLRKKLKRAGLIANE